MRIAFRMSIPLAHAAEYERRHQPIWKELEAVLFAHGVETYSIFLDDSDGSLFGYAEIADRRTWDAIADTAVCQRWWRHMQDLMPSLPDGRPVSTELREVFHVQRGPG